MDTLAMIRQVVGEESVSFTRLIEWKIKAKSMLIIVFDIKGIVHK
jgi:hypothetical protein